MPRRSATNYANMMALDWVSRHEYLNRLSGCPSLVKEIADQFGPDQLLCEGSTGRAPEAVIALPDRDYFQRRVRPRIDMYKLWADWARPGI